ncbi:MMPL family transporter [Streptosporangium roseum]|uniref:Drug exporter of the RND superfamily-like protein n=1 Tax=Streptosporangium roseum (strain ATCC 12428 / DSM 43021 / JCM 3005 / KCTC 9067 / NCIMB 10171 / NRRL 2505 / NI 9100) TaxID=479432 RepID=D2B9D1_STRRD|nr:MMPL family transporter [Streptosporangium roseum]ACZ91676.1 drug exporter of the RND superfamily-like protein [Streptosporangium roseum DSM 43021]
MARQPIRWLVPALLVLVWLAVGGGLGPFAGKLTEVSTNDQAAFLPQSAESTRVLEVQEGFRQGESQPVIVVWTADGKAITPEQSAAATRTLASLRGTAGVVGTPSPAIGSDDGQALQGVIQLSPDLEGSLGESLDRIGSAVAVDGLRAQLAGPAATRADLSDAFAGIDGLLLGVALITVLIILLAVYRSVLLPLVIITGAVFALGLACAVVYFLADRDIVRVDGQVQGILFILVIGAATDYALLLTARFQEELAATGDRFAAGRVALRRSFEPIVASAATVALALLALLLSNLTNNRALGPVGAIGIACAALSALTFLPAALVLLGRAALWPAKPHPVDAKGRGIWGRVAALVDRHPRRLWIATILPLIGLALFAPQLNARGVPLDETFVNDAPSVAAQAMLGEHFPGGSGQPAVIVAPAERAAAVAEAADGVEGVSGASVVTQSGRPGDTPKIVDGRVLVEATLRDAPDSDAAQDTVKRLRAALAPENGVMVGGYSAQRYDTTETAKNDTLLIVPVVLAIILLILIVLLRSLMTPVLLVVTVALNFLATLGVSTLVFTHVFGFTGSDASVPLYGFVFLVALGVDYNIFLMSRVREETAHHGAREGVLRGLVTTGGVITSAGVVLAATFAALVVIPLAFLAQIAFIVAFGVLLDTLVVRSLLVPALVRDLGPRAWWPSRLGRSEVRQASRELTGASK